MNDLEQYFYNNSGRLIHKWKHYFEIYDRHFQAYRGKEIHLLEIGTYHGGSLQMWKAYFGPKAHIYGVDINPLCKNLEEENIKIFTGSQSDRSFLRSLKQTIPKLDILIDDGGHTMEQQIVTFEELYEHVKPNGIYLCEDLHTSYWLHYGGGYRRAGTFIEYSKKLIDYVHAWHSEQKSLQVNDFTKSIYGVHYYDSILVIEKREIEKPLHIKTGVPSFDYIPPIQRSLKEKINARIDLLMNRISRFFDW